jgi:hypothetical protein
MALLLGLLTGLLVQLQAPLKAEFTMVVVDGGPVDAFCGWFDVHFKCV